MSIKSYVEDLMYRYGSYPSRDRIYCNGKFAYLFVIEYSDGTIANHIINANNLDDCDTIFKIKFGVDFHKRVCISKSERGNWDYSYYYYDKISDSRFKCVAYRRIKIK